MRRFCCRTTRMASLIREGSVQSRPSDRKAANARDYVCVCVCLCVCVGVLQATLTYAWLLKSRSPALAWDFGRLRERLSQASSQPMKSCRELHVRMGRRSPWLLRAAQLSIQCS